jgi:hypothetical protein
MHVYKVTDSNGYADAGFEYKGDDTAYVKVAGYETKSYFVTEKDDCTVVEGEDGGEVLGVSTEEINEVGGQVLGASTLGEAGSFEDDLFIIMFGLGLVLTTVGVAVYALEDTR